MCNLSLKKMFASSQLHTLTVSLEGPTCGASPFQYWGRNGHACTAKSSLFVHVQPNPHCSYTCSQIRIVRTRAANPHCCTCAANPHCSYMCSKSSFFVHVQQILILRTCTANPHSSYMYSKSSLFVHVQQILYSSYMYSKSSDYCFTLSCPGKQPKAYAAKLFSSVFYRRRSAHKNTVTTGPPPPPPPPQEQQFSLVLCRKPVIHKRARSLHD